MVMNGPLYERLVAPGAAGRCVTVQLQVTPAATTAEAQQLTLNKQQLRQRVRSLALALEGHGLRCGEQVALGELGDGLAILVAVLAITSCGACVVLGPWLDHIKDLQLSMMLTSNTLEDSAAIKALQRCLCKGDDASTGAKSSMKTANGSSNMSTAVQHGHDQLATIFYTGMTSSRGHKHYCFVDKLHWKFCDYILTTGSDAL